MITLLLLFRKKYFDLGFLDMNFVRLIQTSQLGLRENTELHNRYVLVNNVFNHIDINENARYINS